MRVLLLACLRAAARDREMRDDRRPDWSFLETQEAGPGSRRGEDEDWPRSPLPSKVGLHPREEQPTSEQRGTPFRPPRTAADDKVDSWSYLESKHRLERAKDDEPTEAPPAAPAAANTQGERSHGAPQDGWHDCATLNGDCHCSHGRVRFGRKGKKVDVWTLPIPMGVKEEVTCDLIPLMDVRLHVEDVPGPNPTRQCQCMERRMRISRRFGPPAGAAADKKASLSQFSFDGDLDAELYGPDPAEADKNPHGNYCLAVVKPDGADSADVFLETGSRGIEGIDELNELVAFELSTEVVMERCEEETRVGSKHEWVFQQASGQLRHSKSGKCLGVYWKDGHPHLRGNDCTNVESQVAIQRWSLPFYTDGGGDEATGEFRVGYGASSAKPLCLNTNSHQSHGLSVGACGKDSQWDTERTSIHQWKVCAQENGKCDGDETANCVGEIRFGDGENDNWAFPIAVPSMQGAVAAIACSPAILKQITVTDPVLVPDIDDPEFRQCQCRGAKPKGGSPGAIIGIVLCVVALTGGAGGFFFYKQKMKKKDGDLGEEEWDEWEEEEWEEGEWKEEQ